MIRLVALALVAAACSEEPGDMLPISPGGGGGPGGMTTPDAAAGDGDAGAEIVARVCLINDARSPGTCAATGAGGLTVTLGTASTTTADNGGFTLARPAGADLVWRVTGRGIVPSAMKLSARTSIPALSAEVYADMLSAMQPIVGGGAIIAQITKANVGVAGAVAAAAPLPDSAIYYDGASFTEWDQDATGTFGVVWIPSAAGTTSLSITSTAGSTTIEGIPVFLDGITFAFAEIP